jgi:hypothetical protein
MAQRNAKVDLAKRQAVGIYRPVARFAVKAEGDFRPVEGAKDCYRDQAAKPCNPHTVAVTVLKPAKYVKPEGKRGMATPQMRGFMEAAAGVGRTKRLKGDGVVRFVAIGGVTVKQVETKRPHTGAVYATGAILIPRKV